MKIKREEHIYLSNEEVRLWVDFGDLLQEIQRETQNQDVDDMISDITTRLFYLSDFWESEE